jgi:hypothetical protein
MDEDIPRRVTALPSGALCLFFGENAVRLMLKGSGLVAKPGEIFFARLPWGGVGYVMRHHELNWGKRDALG